MRKTFAGIALCASLACAAITRPASADLTLDPDGAGVTNVNGNTGTSAPGFGSGSFPAPGVGGKSEVYISMNSLFGHDVTIGNIASISFWTNKPGDAGDPDWTLLLYTAKTGTDDTGSFYHSRLNSEPYFTQTPSASDPSNTWHQWSTDGPNPLLFYDQPRSGNFGTYSDPTLAQLQSGGYPSSLSAQLQ